jgi:hypothetical protein
LLAIFSSVGMLMGPPNALLCPKPISSIKTITILGAPFGAFTSKRGGALASRASGDPVDLARAIRQVLTGAVDWQSLRSSAFDRQCQQYTDTTMAAGVAAVYDIVCRPRQHIQPGVSLRNERSIDGLVTNTHLPPKRTCS